MALRKSLTKTVPGFDGELVCIDAYWKVVGVSVSKEQIDFVVHAFSGEQQVGGSPHSFAPDMNGPNFIAQAYLHLKTLPEFEGAVDC